jgi:type I restriction enzyme R subunit
MKTLVFCASQGHGGFLAPNRADALGILERVAARKDEIFTHYDGKLRAFLEFVLAQYVDQGVEELDQEKLSQLLELKYHTIDEAAEALGGVPIIRDTFVGFQKYLYDE